MAFTVDITPKTPTGVIDQTQQFTATPSGQTGDGPITYAWTVDDAPQEETSATFSYVLKGPAGQKTIKVVATNQVAESEPETAEISTTITVQNKTQTTTLAVTPGSPDAGVIGTPIEFTAALASQPSGANATYQWHVDGSPVDEATDATFNYTPDTSGVKKIKCVAQVTAADYDALSVTSNEVSLTVNKKTQTTTLAVTPDSPPAGVIGTAVEFTAALASQPDGASATYQWYVDDSPVGEATNATFSYTPTTSGVKRIKCVAQVTAENYNEKEVTSNEVSLTVNKKTMNPQVTLTPPSINVQQDASATFTANVTDAPEEAQIAYSWKKDSSPVEGSTNVYTVDTSSIGSQTIEVTAVVTATDYDSKTITAEGQVQVTDKVAPEPEGELPYVHPLPHRTSAYIWCGWWVMDEIQKMTEEGKDWKTEDPDSKYYLHRYTLQKMMKDYPEVDVQESRNGYIIHKTALETGIIYTYP
ncbi:PKD domain protein [Escherichia phage vB_EcoM_G10400]|uniref:Highly immunogenic outer capsid protein n=1 Tax=Escherichia phage vB_EcoM_G10400 TaxID=2502300 RepID=A0A482GMJ8_9CAUD|nr:PKD domain protein [Escherichia phage vB_EcoM_G10400]